MGVVQERRLDGLVDKLRLRLEDKLGSETRCLKRIEQVFTDSELRGNDGMEKRVLMNAMDILGITLENADLDIVFDRFDSSGDGELDYSQFLHLLGFPSVFGKAICYNAINRDAYDVVKSLVQNGHIKFDESEKDELIKKISNEYEKTELFELVHHGKFLLWERYLLYDTSIHKSNNSVCLFADDYWAERDYRYVFSRFSTTISNEKYITSKEIISVLQSLMIRLPEEKTNLKGKLDEENFVKFCHENIGYPRKVVIKFLKSKGHFDRLVKSEQLVCDNDSNDSIYFMRTILVDNDSQDRDSDFLYLSSVREQIKGK